MSEARELIAAFHELNRSADRRIGCFTASLVGMFGTVEMLDDFFTQLDTVLATKALDPALKSRATNLMGTFIPQVANFNSIDDLSFAGITAADLRAISTETPQKRLDGVRVILTSFMKILNEVRQAG